MDPRLRTALLVAASLVAAVFLSWKVAEGSYGWPALAAVLITGTVLVRLLRLPPDTIFIGLLLIGYIVGNRGFAQLMPAPQLPLLPAEAGLLLAGAWRGVQWAFTRRLPFRDDPLNWTILAWMLAGSARVIFDVPRFGLLAVRDYATIYYAAFFFLAQDMARDPAARRYLIGCLLAGFLALGPVYALFRSFEYFFVTHLTLNGAPLIYFKGDIAATYLVAGSLLVFHWARGRHRYWAWPAAAGMFLFVMASDSRAAQLGALLIMGVLLLRRHWRFPALNGGLTVLALTVIVALAVFLENDWAGRKLHGLGDRLASLVDFTGTGTYTSEESFFKGDNNRFRLVWWKNVAEETWHTNPAFGLGFGADLAAGFVQEYYPDASEEFSVRSPHNIYLTAFGRMGLAGLAVLGVFGAILLRAIWRAPARLPEPADWALWCGAGVIFCSAIFGVVLEGPMGAVVFWIMLGLAHRAPAADPAPETPEAAPVEAAAV